MSAARAFAGMLVIGSFIRGRKFIGEVLDKRACFSGRFLTTTVSDRAVSQKLVVSRPLSEGIVSRLAQADRGFLRLEIVAPRAPWL
jgi:hypothetical protein